MLIWITKNSLSLIVERQPLLERFPRYQMALHISICEWPFTENQNAATLVADVYDTKTIRKECDSNEIIQMLIAGLQVLGMDGWLDLPHLTCLRLNIEVCTGMVNRDGKKKENLLGKHNIFSIHSTILVAWQFAPAADSDTVIVGGANSLDSVGSLTGGGPVCLASALDLITKHLQLAHLFDDARVIFVGSKQLDTLADVDIIEWSHSVLSDSEGLLKTSPTFGTRKASLQRSGLQIKPISWNGSFSVSSLIRGCMLLVHSKYIQHVACHLYVFLTSSSDYKIELVSLSRSWDLFYLNLYTEPVREIMKSEKFKPVYKGNGRRKRRLVSPVDRPDLWLSIGQNCIS
ncbi:hypothetical protein VP01_657g1 [Puccinia sorghi]|uniref:Uncharacterized protein n=1 Tax=Puccinia sorghi TaxID=27349 RepID=A0A0L6UF80_9BASI|nr:hypothetical protein VP01_657g1 [Puccinia sorghi]